MLGPKLFLSLAILLVSQAPPTGGLGKPRTKDCVQAECISKTSLIYSRFLPSESRDIAKDIRISGKWYSAVNCPAWSGRYIFRIQRLPDGALQGSSIGVSFGAKGHSSEIASGTISSGTFEFLERSNKGFLAFYKGRIGSDGSALIGTYKNTRSGMLCHFVMKRSLK